LWGWKLSAKIAFMAYDEKTAERVRKVLSGRRDVIERKMMGGLCFMVSGNMCCVVSGRGGMLIRIDKAAQERVFAQPHVRPLEMGARIIQGFVRLDPEGYRTDAGLRKWVGCGLDVVAKLPAKPARKASKRRTKP
jgi:TfoX/Sxy family transcriptional regulator of competence genes